jgi:hypothetical protein
MPMDDPNEKRRSVLTAAAQTIATACRHLYEDELNAARGANDVVAIVRAKAALKKDYTEWTAPIFAALEALDRPPAIVIPSPLAVEKLNGE